MKCVAERGRRRGVSIGVSPALRAAMEARASEAVTVEEAAVAAASFRGHSELRRSIAVRSSIATGPIGGVGGGRRGSMGELPPPGGLHSRRGSVVAGSVSGSRRGSVMLDESAMSAFKTNQRPAVRHRV